MERSFSSVVSPEELVEGVAEPWMWMGLKGLNQPPPWFGYQVTHRHVTAYL